MAQMLLFTKYKSVSPLLSFLYCVFLTQSGCWIKHFYLQRMRKNLLRLIHVKEFAPEAQFHDPCPSFILPNVICRYVDLPLVVLVIYLQNILVKTAQNHNFSVCLAIKSHEAKLTLCEIDPTHPRYSIANHFFSSYLQLLQWLSWFRSRSWFHVLEGWMALCGATMWTAIQPWADGKSPPPNSHAERKALSLAGSCLRQV